MALNRDNVMVFNTHVSVTSNNGGGNRDPPARRPARHVELCRRALRSDPHAGDAKELFDKRVGQLTGHQSAARGAAVAEAKN
jgi:hypothetical protein